MWQPSATAPPIDAETLNRDPRVQPLHDHVYDILDENLGLVREVSIQDFRTAFERW